MTPHEPSPVVRRLRAGSLRPAVVHGRTPGTIMLSSGDPDFATPDPVLRAATAAMDEGRTGYGDLTGDPELRETAAAVTSAVAGYRYTAAEVLVTNGASSGAHAALTATVSPGDRVLLLDPTYSLFEAVVQMAGGVPVHVPLDPAGHLDLEAIERQLPGCRLLVLVNPSNPTGAVFTRDELTQLAGLTARHGVVVVSDEVCDRFTFDGRTFASAVDIDQWRDRLIYCQSMSKTSSMTGWRVGYTIAPAPLIDDIALVHRNTLTSVNTIAQRAALAALRTGLPWTSDMSEILQRRRDLVIEHVRAIPGLSADVPEGGLFAFPRYEHRLGSVDVTRELALRGVLVRAGREFGPSGEGHLRLSLTASESVLANGLDRIADYFARPRSPR
ncbi:pyridoxal phosphate-dependent aminotransferase [Jiangella endophytica]|uniref:pyridoxal phosphate-dependent aminotransferase n=1 Tax=Jiangella endophytica TaxID=1623398 RepID=UPI000E34606F|nr:pyridoxal phosphate-dependent aminotransferase [Jiangella endophytica]